MDLEEIQIKILFFTLKFILLNQLFIAFVTLLTFTRCHTHIRARAYISELEGAYCRHVYIIIYKHFLTIYFLCFILIFMLPVNKPK
jgi:hypothetical protein